MKFNNKVQLFSLLLTSSAVVKCASFAVQDDTYDLGYLEEREGDSQSMNSLNAEEELSAEDEKLRQSYLSAIDDQGTHDLFANAMYDEEIEDGVMREIAQPEDRLSEVISREAERQGATAFEMEIIASGLSDNEFDALATRNIRTFTAMSESFQQDSENGQQVKMMFYYEELEQVSLFYDVFDILSKLLGALFITILLELAIVSWRGNNEAATADELDLEACEKKRPMFLAREEKPSGK